MALSFVDIAIFLIAFLAALYYYGMKSYNCFDNTKIKHTKPSFPLLGSMENVILRRGDIIDFLKKGYQSHPGEK